LPFTAPLVLFEISFTRFSTTTKDSVVDFAEVEVAKASRAGLTAVC
jgi:hypothetical protein